MMEGAALQTPKTSTPKTATSTASTKVWTASLAAPEKRNLWNAMLRGCRGRCPNCGEGKLFRAFLKTAECCSKCGQDFTHHRADDLPAYLVIVVVGHIMVPLALWIETNFSPSVALQLSIYLPLTLVFSLLLLQPIKGAVVGLQWALRMHGFDESGAESEPDHLT